jgi:hypothetical protein
MKRLLLAACLLSVPGLAAAQSGAAGSVTIDTGTGINLTTTLPPGTILDLTAPPPGTVTIVTLDFAPPTPLNFYSMFGAALRPADPALAVPALNPLLMLEGQRPIVTIEEDGVRLPDEQFTLP